MAGAGPVADQAGERSLVRRGVWPVEDPIATGTQSASALRVCAFVLSVGFAMDEPCIYEIRIRGHLTDRWPD
jgi:hypothetical protein